MATRKTAGKAKAAPKASDAETKKTRGRAAQGGKGGKPAKAPKAPGAVKAAPAAPAEEKALPPDDHLALTELKEAPLPAVEDESALLPVVEAPADKPAKAPKAKAAAAPKAAREAAKAGAPKTAAPKAEAPKAKAAGPDAAAKAGPRLPDGITPRPLMTGNPYLPKLATVVEIIQETRNIRTLRVVLDDAEAMESFTFEPGQVGQVSVFGAGEATFVINSPPSEKSFLQFSVMDAGEVTDAIHHLSPGDKVGVRAPLGNYFPWQDWKGKNVFFIGGGIGMAPIRTIMLHLLERKEDYGKISLLYGARSPKDMAYSYELDDWTQNPDLDCTLCIDNPYDTWGHKVGLIPKVLEELAPSPENTVAVLCGPPIMIRFTLEALEKLGFAPENIVTTLEKRMKCGIGICGRCNIGSRYVCVDGPVFTLKELQGLPPDM